MNELDELQQQEEPQAAGVPPSARLLLRVVYIMGIMLVLLFLALVGGIIWKSTRKADPKPVAPARHAEPRPAPGERYPHRRYRRRPAGRSTPAREVIVIDLRKNAIVSRISAGP